MSDLAIGRARTTETFRAGTVALILAIGVIGFAGMLILGAFAPDLRSGHDGKAHALSNAGVGFSGIVALAAATGRNPIVIRNEHQFGSEDLLVVTPDSGFTDLTPQFTARAAKPTLYVLPKWQTKPDEAHRGWVELQGLLPPFDPASLKAPGTTLKIARRRARRHRIVATAAFDAATHFVAPPLLQVITGTEPNGKRKQSVRRPNEPPIPPSGDVNPPDTLYPLLTDGAGGIVLARMGDGPLYVLADPDLMSNAGLKNPRNAAAALAMLDWMNSTGATSIGFDVTANGLGHSQSPLKLAFTPPFLAMTLVLAAVLLLVGWHALGRFGPIAPRERAIAFGKAALVENSAKLMQRAGRERKLGGRYAQMIREQASATFGVPARLKDAALDDYLDGLGTAGSGRFSELARAAEATDDRATLVEAAHALHQWREMIR